MFNKEKYLKEIGDKYQLDNQDVKKILEFFIGKDYEIKIPNNLSEMKINNRPVINLELSSSMLSAHIIGSENPNDCTIQLNVYENNQSAEVLSKIICFKAIDGGDLRGCSIDWFSDLRMEILDYLHY
jgi:flagellar motor switch protein FliG